MSGSGAGMAGGFLLSGTMTFTSHAPSCSLAVCGPAEDSAICWSLICKARPERVAGQGPPANRIPRAGGRIMGEPPPNALPCAQRRLPASANHAPISPDTKSGDDLGGIMSGKAVSRRMRRMQWIAVGLVTAAIALNYMDRSTLEIGNVKIRQEFGLNATEIGALQS